MAELGNTLSRARRARGITLEDAERDTHVSRRYLNALEMEDFSIFPAPVYARGFLRTYSRYLGLNPDDLIRVFPNEELVVDIKPLPTVTRPATQVFNLNYVVAGLVAVFLIGAALLLFRGGDDTPTTGNPNATRSNTAVAGAGTSVIAASSPVPQSAVPGKTIGPVRPGQFPDFVGADLASSLAVLRDNQMSYVIVEATNRTTPRGIVVSQSPSGGSKADDDSTVTLLVSAGPPSQ